MRESTMTFSKVNSVAPIVGILSFLAILSAILLLLNRDLGMSTLI